jgi:hypothetical protein
VSEIELTAARPAESTRKQQLEAAAGFTRSCENPLAEKARWARAKMRAVVTTSRNRFPTGAPPLEMRVMTKERRVGVELADDLPNYSGHSDKFMLKLITAWIEMGFRRPEITLGKTVHRAQ